MNFNYTNPAFCLQSEELNYTPPAKILRNDAHFRSFNEKRSVFRVAPPNLNTSLNLPPKPGPKPTGLAHHQIQREQQRFVQEIAAKHGHLVRSQSLLEQRTLSVESINRQPAKSSGRYALVPIEELPTASKDRYELLPIAKPQNSHRNLLHKSHDQIFSEEEENEHIEDQLNRTQPQFSSLPPTINEPQSRMKNAFSTNFDPKQFILNESKYTLIPTEKDEEIVDDNHEVIEIHNGKGVHRYAVLSTEIDEEDEQGEEEETCLSDTSNFEVKPLKAAKQPIYNPQTAFITRNLQNHSYATIQERNGSPQRVLKPALVTSSPQQITPQKNLATQKLHELLSTPQKPRTPSSEARTPQKTRFQSTPIRYEYEREIDRRVIDTQSHTPQRTFTPQRLRYDQRSMSIASVADARTTAIISPRLQQLHAASTNDLDKSREMNESFYKVANATATIGCVCMMMILCGIMNSGLCLYIIAVKGLVYYLTSGIVAGFACVALGGMGFRSRHSNWLPNRNYVSGMILVTIFSLLNCCGLVVLMVLNPYPGSPIHDMITGVVLGLAALTLLFISLGVISSQFCSGPPPDNRVDVC